MYEPRYRTKRNGVPILSKQEINAFAEGFIQDFQESALKEPEPLDIEGLLELYLGMTADYQYLSHNGIYLGMTVFNETEKIPVYDPITNRAEYIHADANTVIIDRRLIEDEKQEHRLRFTQAHEAGHGIFHKQYHYQDPRQISMFAMPGKEEDRPMILCRSDKVGSRGSGRNSKKWTDNDSMEWQANAMASALLMPRPAIRRLFGRNGMTGTRCSQIVKTIYDLVRECDVSHEAALYRLADLGYIDQCEMRSFSPGSPLMAGGRNL